MLPIRTVLLLAINQRRCCSYPFFWLGWDLVCLFLGPVLVICQLNVLCAVCAVSLQALVALLSPGMADSQCSVPRAPITSLLAAYMQVHLVGQHMDIL